MNRPTSDTGVMTKAGNLLLLGSALTLALAACAPEGGKESGSVSDFKPDMESLRAHNSEPEWFRDAKFGIYFHWGVYSVPAYSNEWYPRNMYNTESEVYDHHRATYGSPDDYGYPDFVSAFRAERFDPEAWAALFKRAGARFAGPVAEHHDGFAMWDSEVTPWNAADRGPKRDITGELATAIRNEGMKFVTTFHHARNNLWKPEGEGEGEGNGEDAEEWTGHYSYVRRYFPALLDDPERAIMYGYMPRPEFLRFWGDKLKEVVEKYRPDLMWFDSWLDEIPDSVKADYLAHYFNRAGQWGKEVVVTYKQQDLPADIGVKDFEKGRAGEIQDRTFLTDDTISKGSWCYTRDLEIKSTREVLHSLIDIVSKNGQLLLNISPKADGTIPENQRKVLLEMGDWLRINGEAIYGTRPWEVYGEGPTKLKEGPFEGFTDAGGYTSEDIRYTARADTVYAIVLGETGAGREIRLDAFRPDRLGRTVSVSDIAMVGSGEPVTWETDPGEGLSIRTTAPPPDKKAVVFKIITGGG